MTGENAHPNSPDRRLGVKELGALLEVRDPAAIAAEALSLLTTRFGATAGTLFYATRPPLQVRRGAMSEVVAEHMDRWVTNVKQRVLAGTWQLGEKDEALWISRSIQGTDQGMIYSLLLEGATVVGTICLTCPPRLSLTRGDRAALDTFLRAVGSLLGLLTEHTMLKERLGQLSLFYQVAQSTASTFNVSQVLNDIMQLATAVIDASASALMLVDEDRQELLFEYAQGELGNILRKQRTALDEGIAGWVASRGVPVVVNDVHSDPRFSPLVDKRTGFLTQSVLCVPLQIRNRIIGVLEVLNKRSGKGFDSEDLNLMMTTATQAAIAIERAQLYQNLRDERDRVIQAQENVRRQVAQNLHDGTVQYLSAISMSINHLERLLEREPQSAQAELEQLRELAREATRQARLALFELRPVILETQGLVPALEAYVQQLQGSEQFGIHFEQPDSLPELTTSVAATIFSIVQEAVTNVKKHASARDAWLRLSMEGGWLQVVIEDNGAGFDLKAVEREYDRQGSIGLLSMRERAELIDGDLEIRSAKTQPRSGTQVIVRIPVSSAPNRHDPNV